MRAKLNKEEIAKIVNLQDRLDSLRGKIEENDVQLNWGNGTASEQLGCAVAALECILQEYF